MKLEQFSVALTGVFSNPPALLGFRKGHIFFGRRYAGEALPIVSGIRYLGFLLHLVSDSNTLLHKPE